MSNIEIITARKQLGGFFKARREEMGIPVEVLAEFAGISANTLNRVESGAFAWDVDLHIKICEFLKIELPYERS